ncbi:MAG TPA: PHP domain-containing protein [Steroidobacteraceae bacterium]|nr:PHP domain-containing protein [Steroidobacteraceae bacterium]
MNDGIDLHLHSTCSDGVLSPAALVGMLAASGIGLFALTDHDTVAGLEAADAAARAAGLRAIPGIELSARWEGRDVHVVGLGIDPGAAAIRVAVAALLDLRRARAADIAARLERARAPGRAALARVSAHEMPTRTHFARALVELGAARDVPAAFTRWLGRGRPAHVSPAWPELGPTVESITAAGGVAVLAHPLRYTLSAGQRRRVIREFRAAGGIALEVVSGGAAPHQIETALGLALRAGLEGSVGSDCHDPDLPWHRPGRLAKLPLAVAPVWHRWAPTPRRTLEA